MSSNAWVGHNPAKLRTFFRATLRYILLEPEMSQVAMVVVNVAADDPRDLALVQGDDVVETVSP
ncbi:hypothetical protein PPSIR1_37954 [Plesiocystis pacifica SIR-1]|uniref:Uncharacterized protein n=1 Tax=Plesiocystis pacifica SIR-1 TaxID=391625 RepID=A6G9N0_9BACT|nr:hypothetical protein PPSIR1_37954 [Plesiocystis pacifica SIR-1]